MSLVDNTQTISFHQMFPKCVNSCQQSSKQPSLIRLSATGSAFEVYMGKGPSVYSHNYTGIKFELCNMSNRQEYMLLCLIVGAVRYSQSSVCSINAFTLSVYFIRLGYMHRDMIMSTPRSETFNVTTCHVVYVKPKYSLP